MTTHHRHTKQISLGGISKDEASKALIMIHGRGGSAEDFLRLAQQLNVPNFTLLAPQAYHNSWYHYACTSVLEHNEPWLSSILVILEELVNELVQQKFRKQDIYLLGFSQGACLCLEFVARNASRFGGVVAFTGGLMGEKLHLNHYQGDLKETPIFISTGEQDEHIPLKRVHQTVDLLNAMNGAVSLKVYPNKPHAISTNEIEQANQLIFPNSSNTMNQYMT